MDHNTEEPNLFEEDSGHIDSSSESDKETLESKDGTTKMENAISVTHKEGDNEPKIGMLFSNEDEAYNFYKNYARRKGFSVRRGQYRRLADGSIRKRLFVCSKEGSRRKSKPEHVRKVDRLETRTGCLAMILLTVEKDGWVVTQFVHEHNHDMVSSDKKDMLRSQRHIDEANGDLIETMDNIYSDFVEEAGGDQNVGFVRSDYDNYLKKRIKNLEAGDVQGVINHFKHMQADDPSFFYTVQVDSENRMTNFFWRDGRSKTDYNYFSDVVVFDTKYRINKYDMVCAPFLGVNHHKQNILFGCAFLLAETTESFIWLFESFLEAMGKRQPRTIFTDQCQLMANAIEKVFPEAQHRLCLWNIGQNAAKHIGHCQGEPEFISHFNNCIHDCETEQEFEEKWTQLIKKYDLLENQWLTELYNLRAKWCPTSNEDYFSAGIISSESMNNVFCEMTSRTMSLTEFVVEYEKVAERMRRAELVEDLCCNQGAPPGLGKVSGMVKQASIIYTPAIFQIFHEELCECLAVAIEEIGNDGTFYTYKLIKDGDEKECFVKFNVSNCMVECSCKKFESMGLLCLHALRVYNARNIFQIPSQYILKRWTRCAKDGLVTEDNGKETVEKAKKPIRMGRSQLMHKAVQFASKGALTSKITKMAEEILHQGLITLENALKELKEDDVGDKNPFPSSSTQIPVLNSGRVSSKGLKNARLKNQVEKRCKKIKTQVEHASNDANTTKHPSSKKVVQGKKSGSRGINHNIILPKPPTISNHHFFPATGPVTHRGLQFVLQGCNTSSMPLGMSCMPMHPLSEGPLPSWSGHHSLQDNQTLACTEVDLNRQLPHFSQRSLPSLMGQRNLQDAHTLRACNEVNLNNRLPQFNQESSGGWTFGRPSLQDASLIKGAISDFNGQMTQPSQGAVG